MSNVGHEVDVPGVRGQGVAPPAPEPADYSNTSIPSITAIGSGGFRWRSLPKSRPIARPHDCWGAGRRSLTDSVIALFRLQRFRSGNFAAWISSWKYSRLTTG